MLSVVFAESYDNLAHLLRFYAPKADKLLDVTYGGGTLSKRSPIPVVGIDKDPTSKSRILADAKALPFCDATFPVGRLARRLGATHVLRGSSRAT